MALSLQFDGADKDQLVVSLAALILSDCEVEITTESLDAIVSSSGNKVPSYYTSLFASLLSKAGGCDKFLAGPSAGGGGGGGAAAPAAAGGAAAPAAAAKAAAPVEEEVDALDGGMDMFGGGGAKTGDY